MLSQTVNKCPGWNHEIAIGWRSKNMVKNVKYLEILPLLSCERGNPSDNGEGKIQNAILTF